MISINYDWLFFVYVSIPLYTLLLMNDDVFSLVWPALEDGSSSFYVHQLE